MTHDLCLALFRFLRPALVVGNSSEIVGLLSGQCGAGLATLRAALTLGESAPCTDTAATLASVLLGHRPSGCGIDISGIG